MAVKLSNFGTSAVDREIDSWSVRPLFQLASASNETEVRSNQSSQLLKYSLVIALLNRSLWVARVTWEERFSKSRPNYKARRGWEPRGIPYVVKVTVAKQNANQRNVQKDLKHLTSK